MTNMMEKPQSKKAKTYNRFSGKQDHGDAASRKGHINYGYWEDQYEHRGAVNKDKTMVKQDLHGELNAFDDIRDDNFALDMAEQDKKMAEAWAEQLDDEFDNDMEYSSTTGDIYVEDGMGHSEYLKFLNNKLNELRSELESIPHLDHNDPDHQSNDQARLSLESEILEVVAEIREALNQYEHPEASYDTLSKRALRRIAEDEGSMYDNSEDDPVDSHWSSGMRIRRR